MKQTIYKKDTTGKIRFITVENQGIEIVQTSGVVGTDKPVEARKAAKPKNVGRANETTAEEQALKECEALIVDKLTKGYFGTIEEAENEEVILPMLAKDYFKEEKKIKEGEVLILNPKLDGCFTYSTLIETDEGLIPIGDIVNNKMEVKVKSYNEAEDKIEYKKIVNWFNNGITSSKDFNTIELLNGMEVSCTKNHKFYTQRGWVSAEDLIVGEDYIKVSKEADNFRRILGSFLGDGCIPMDKRSEYSSKFTMCQGQDQKEYLEYKIGKLREEFKVLERVSGYGGKVYDAIMKGFFRYKEYSKLLVDNEGKKMLTQKFLNKYLNEEGLAIWIADDGSLAYNNGNSYSPVLTLSTHAFNEEQLDIFIKYFSYKWGVEPVKSVDKRGRGTSLRFNTKDTVYLLNRLKYNIPQGVEYKFYFEPKERKDKEIEGFQKVTNRRGVTGASYNKYDIEVEDNHNYFAEGFLAHNCRLLLDIDPDKDSVKLVSRQGKEFTTLPHIEAEAMGIMAQLKMEGKGRLILDGEVYAHGLTFQENMSLIKKVQPGQEQLQFVVYDIVDLEKTYEKRLQYLSELFNTKDFHCFPRNKRTICVIPWVLDNKNNLEPHFAWCIENGYEGMMVKRVAGKYKINGRSSELLKYKKFIDIALEIKDVIPTDADPTHGLFTFHWEGAVDDTLKCGMKFSHAERQEFLSNKEQYIGKTAELRFFEYSDTGVPRFPLAVGIRLDK